VQSVLLVEPDYKNKFPPLGLMKLATYFREREVVVEFVKGKSMPHRQQRWDAVFVTTLFTWEWKRTVETIRYYSRATGSPTVYVGGILATLMPEELEDATGATIVTGLLDRDGKLGLPDDGSIEQLTPDYSILDDINYEYPVRDAYFVHATRGCVNACEFCAVTTVEPRYEGFRSIAEQVESIRSRHGEKRDLVLMDNNTVASPKFDKIIDEIIDAGFGAGSRLHKRKRHVDFNQGLDARLMTETKVQRLAETAIWPLRIAFDFIDLREEYEQAVRWAAQYGLKRLSNYVLFNYEDAPEDFYERLRLNIDLNEELGTHIYSFPMRYSPVGRVDRNFIAKNWTWRYIRGVQCILNATRGVVGVKKEFFNRAFGKSADEFIELISMPEDYIINRTEHETDAALWREQYRGLSEVQLRAFKTRALARKIPSLGSDDHQVEAILAHY
jgi:hypothetical protein